MEEFRLLESGLRFDGGKLRYAWFRIHDPVKGEIFRCVALKELAYLPLEARQDPDVLGKQWAAVRGLYNAEVDFCYVAMGVFRPRRLGIAQFYGASAEDVSEEKAAQEVLRRMAAVEAVLANFPHSRLKDADTERVQLLIERLEKLPRIIAILGHPDPRAAPRGLGRDGSLGETDEELASQQNEMLFRGLAKLKEDFVFLVTGHRLDRGDLASALVKMAQAASNFASRQRGTIGASFSIAIPIMAAIASAYGSTRSGATSRGRSYTEGVSEGWGVAHGRSWAHTVGKSEGISESHTESGGVTSGTALTTGSGHTDSFSHTDGGAHTDSHSLGASHTTGSSWSTSTTTSVAHTSGTAETTGVSHTASISHGSSVEFSASHGTSHTETSSSSVSLTNTQGESHAFNKHLEGSVSGGIEGGVGIGVAHIGLSAGSSLGGGVGWTDTTHTSTSVGTEVGHSTAQGTSHTSGVSIGASSSAGTADTQSASHTTSSSVSVSSSTTTTSGGFSSTTHSESWGTADTKSWANTKGHADSTAQSVTQSFSSTRGWADTHTESKSTHEAWSEGRSEVVSQSVGRSAGWGITDSEGKQISGISGWGGGFSGGIIPGVSISRSWQTEDDTAIRLTEIARQLESLLNQASTEGGFMTTALLLTGEEGARAAEALVPQAFHGQNVPTPVLTVAGDESLRAHAFTFRPSLVPDGDPFGVGLWTKWGTLLTPGQVAAYTAPGVFEEGTAVTVQELIPPTAFYPTMEGDCLLGHQISPETGELTDTPLRLSKNRHFHTAFVADTGFGKSVAAERLVYETALRYGIKTVVLDFGAGWRKLLNAPGLEGKVDIRQLSPGGVRPLRWNPLQVGRNILPEVQWRAFTDIFGAIARLGVRRQIGELRDALRRVYLRAGVLVDDPEVRQDPVWGKVRPGEEEITGVVAGTPLADLSPEARQALAVERSKTVGLHDLYREIEEKLATVPPRDTMLRGVLEGILYRLHPLVQGAASAQYAAGGDAEDISALAEKKLIVLLEGGAFLDEFSKAFLLGWAAWQIYTDAVVRRIRNAAQPTEYIQIVFEEANKILAGVDAGEDEEGGAAYTSEQFASMWRDSRKYGMWMHIITQSPSLIPPGILSSCNNIIVGQLKNPRDRDLVIAAIHRSEKGFVDERWRRFLASLPVARMVAKLGYTFDRAELEPIYFQPLPVTAREPTDEEIAEKLGRIEL